MFGKIDGLLMAKSARAHTRPLKPRRKAGGISRGGSRGGSRGTLGLTLLLLALSLALVAGGSDTTGARTGSVACARARAAGAPHNSLTTDETPARRCSVSHSECNTEVGPQR